MTQPTEFEQVSYNSPDGAQFGKATSDKIGFLAATPVSQRASSVQATTNIATSTAFGATQLATVQEIMNTLAALGLWKGSA